jgi:hypothetical protein
VEEAYQVVVWVAGERDGLQGTYSAEELTELDSVIASCAKWAKLCRGKVWLRSAEGTARSEGCLVAASELKTNIGKPAAAIDAAIDLSSQLESLARVIATKAQVIT